MQTSPNLVNLHNQIGQTFSLIENSFFCKNPVFIVSTPRSGSNLLFEQLTDLPNIWSIGAESHGVFAEFLHLRYENQAIDSACLTPQHADNQTSYLFKLALFSRTKDYRNNYAIHQMQNIAKSNNAFLEKTPRNALNIPFLKTIFPNAKFIYLFREPKQNVASIIEAWKIGKKTGQFVTFNNLPGWDRKYWCLLLPRNWKKMNGKNIAEISYFQWLESNRTIMFDLSKLPDSDWTSLEYKSLIKKPYKQISKLLKFCEISIKLKKDKYDKLSLSKTALSKPSKNKWRKHEKKMSPMIEQMELDYQGIKRFCKK